MAATLVLASSQYLSMNNSLTATQNQSGVSMCLWVQPVTLTGVERYLMIFTVNGSTINGRTALSVRSGISYRARSRRLDFDVASTVDSTTVPATGTRVHLCATYGWSSGAMIIYVNGVQENSLTIGSWTGNSSNTIAGGSGIGTGPDHSNSTMADAIFDDVRIYQRVLTANEVRNIASGRGRDTVVYGMFDRWKLMDGSLGATIGTTASIGSNQGRAVATNSPVYSQALGTVTRRRRH
jgi:hypothetical protein